LYEAAAEEGYCRWPPGRGKRTFQRGDLSLKALFSIAAPTSAGYDAPRKRELLKSLLEQLKDDDDSQELKDWHLGLIMRKFDVFATLPDFQQIGLLYKAQDIEAERGITDVTARRQAKLNRRSREETFRRWHEDNRRLAPMHELQRQERRHQEARPSSSIQKYRAIITYILSAFKRK
jgi:hypothetical protein